MLARLSSGGLAPPLRPHLGGPLEVQRGLPADPGRAGLGAEGADRLAGQLRVLGGAAGELQGEVLDLVVGHRLPGQADLRGAHAVDRLAEQAHRGGGLAARRPAADREVAAAGVQADAQEPGEQPGALGDDAQVGGEGQVDPRADRGAADGGDGRHLQRAHAAEGGVDRAELLVGLVLGLVAARRPAPAVGAGAEGAARAADDGRADRRVGVHLVAQLRQLQPHLRGEPVLDLGVVDREHGDAAVPLQLDLSHGGCPASLLGSGCGPSLAYSPTGSREPVVRTRTSTAVAPHPRGATINGLTSNSASRSPAASAACDSRTTASTAAGTSAGSAPRKPASSGQARRLRSIAHASSGVTGASAEARSRYSSVVTPPRPTVTTGGKPSRPAVTPRINSVPGGMSSCTSTPSTPATWWARAASSSSVKTAGASSGPTPTRTPPTSLLCARSAAASLSTPGPGSAATAARAASGVVTSVDDGCAMPIDRSSAAPSTTGPSNSARTSVAGTSGTAGSGGGGPPCRGRGRRAATRARSPTEPNTGTPASRNTRRPSTVSSCPAIQPTSSGQGSLAAVATRSSASRAPASPTTIVTRTATTSTASSPAMIRQTSPKACAPRLNSCAVTSTGLASAPKGGISGRSRAWVAAESSGSCRPTSSHWSAARLPAPPEVVTTATRVPSAGFPPASTAATASSSSMSSTSTTPYRREVSTKATSSPSIEPV